jgi:RNA polymerase sigma factor (sigma-70 family)
MGEFRSNPPPADVANDIQRAMEVLMRAVPGVRALLLRMTRDLEVTKDLTQDVTLAVWQTIQSGGLREPAALPAYVLQCARNAALAHTRKMRPTTMADLPEREQVWADRPKTPLECCEAQELSVLAKQSVTELPTQRDRDLIQGFYVEGQSKEELMSAFGLARDQFDRVISRARGRMRDLLRGKLDADSGHRSATRSGGPDSETAI